jgi:endonuclease YncB( thermonuclease family)
MEKFWRILAVFWGGLFLLGNIFFWYDDQGVRHFSNVAPPGDRQAEEQKESRSVYKKLTAGDKKTQRFTVLRVYDGDTIKVSGLGLVFKIRLAGIDAPEIGYNGQESQLFSHRARKKLQSLLADKTIRLKSHGIGGYNRQLAEVFVNSTNINIEMIKAGLAEVYRGKRPKTLDSKLYLEQEAAARTAGIGMWGRQSFYTSPKLWRKSHPYK